MNKYIYYLFLLLCLTGCTPETTTREEKSAKKFYTIYIPGSTNKFEHSTNYSIHGYSDYIYFTCNGKTIISHNYLVVEE